MFNLYQGVVEDNEDELKLGRYRVRVFGIHTDNKGVLPTEDLPWAITMQPTTSAATSGVGTSPRLVKGSWVIVTFLDADFQKPLVLGSIAGIQGDGAVGEMDLESEIKSVVPPTVAPAPVVQMPDGTQKPTTEVTSIPAGATIVEPGWIGTLTKSQIGKLKDEIAKHETGGKNNPYAVQNSIGFIGKYQFGADYLKDMGYINIAATGKNKAIVDNASNWTGKNGITSKEVFYQKIDLQESLMDEMLRRNYSIMRKAGVVSPDTPPEKLAGMLCAAHLKGAGGAIKFARGQDSADAYGTSCSAYYKYGYSSIAGAETNEAPTIPNMDYPAVDKHATTQYQDARKYDTGATKPRKGVQGFNDPSGQYPIKSLLDESDVNRLARASKISQTIVGVKEADLVKHVPTANGGSWKQSPVPYNAKYPYNQVIASEAGHIIELDDTDGCERLNIHHSSGTFSEVDAEGNQVNRVKGIRTVIVDEDELVYIKGSGHVTVDGDVSLRVAQALQVEILGNANVRVHGSMNQVVDGDYSLNVRGNFNLQVGGNLTSLTSGTLDIGSAGAGSVKCSTFNLTASNWFVKTDILEGFSYIIGDVVTGGGTGANVGNLTSYSPVIRIPKPVSRSESVDMVIEDNPELAARIYADAPPPVKQEESNEPAKEVLPVSGSCGFTELSSELELSTNYKLKDLCRDGGFAFGGQHNLKAEELACNLKQLCINVIEPLRAKYAHLGFKINSCFRPAGSAVSHAAPGKVSKHELGCAVDISFSAIRGKPNDREEFYKLAKEIKDLVPFDQLLLEYTSSGSVWIHISYIPNGNLKREILTLNNHSTYAQGLVLLT